MANIYKQNLVSSSKYSIKCPHSLTPQYIVVHDTANSAPASNEISYMIRNDNQVSFHIAVDEKEAIQGLPLNRNSWSCGDGTNGNGNRKGISVEICRPTNSNRSLYDQSEENAVYVVARLLHKYGLGIDRLKRHYDFATNKKQCPNVIIREGRWDNFKSRVEWVLGEIKKGTIEGSLESGTTGITKQQSTSKPQTNIKTKSCERKVKAVCDVNIWDGTDYKNVVDHVKKGEVVYFNEITECGGFGKLGNGRYISLDHNLFFMWDLWSKPQGKIHILEKQINAWSGASYESKVVGHVYQHEVLEFTDERNGMVCINNIGWVTLDPKMVKRNAVNEIATTYR